RVMLHWLPRMGDISRSAHRDDLRSTLIAPGKEISHDLPPAVHGANRAAIHPESGHWYTKSSPSKGMPMSAIFRNLWSRKTSEAQRYSQRNLRVTLTFGNFTLLLCGSQLLSFWDKRSDRSLSRRSRLARRRVFCLGAARPSP